MWVKFIYEFQFGPGPGEFEEGILVKGGPSELHGAGLRLQSAAKKMSCVV